MSERPDLVVVGDMMFECMIRLPQLPDLNSTAIVDPSKICLGLGGSPINVSWHLGQLGRRPRIVGFCGSDDETRLARGFCEASVDWSGVSLVPGGSDVLLSFLTPEGHRSAYVLGVTPVDAVQHYLTHCSGCKLLIVNGTRHLSLRAAWSDLVSEIAPEFLVFSPSYAVHEYQVDEFASLAKAAHVTFLNEHEVVAACRFLNVGTPDKLSQCVRGVVVCTYGDRGATIWRNGDALHVRSVSGVKGDVVGAGDAFLAGFVHEHLAGSSNLADAGSYAAALASIIVRSGTPRPVVSDAAVRALICQESGKQSAP